MSLNDMWDDDEDREQFTVKAEATKPCVCCEPTTPGVVHRADGPCYLQEATKPQDPTTIPSSEDYAETHKMAVTSEWLAGWNNCKELVEAFPVATKPQEPCDVPPLPDLPAGIVKHEKLGDLYDRLQVQQYAVRYYDATQQPCPKCAELEAECGFDQRNAEASQRESVLLLDKVEILEAERDALKRWVEEYQQTLQRVVEQRNAFESKRDDLEHDRDALAITVQQMREALKISLEGFGVVIDVRGKCDWPTILQAQQLILCALALPDHFEIIKRHDAEVLRNAADEACPNSYDYDDVELSIRRNIRSTLLDMADELGKS